MALIKDRLGLEADTVPGTKGQFDVRADGELIASRGGNLITRSFGLGYPDLTAIVDSLEEGARRGSQ